jgi:hypothetical protein
VLGGAVLLELCELDELQTLSLLCGEQEEDFTGDMSPISLLLFLLRQGLSLDDKKACCAVGSLLMWYDLHHCDPLFVPGLTNVLLRYSAAWRLAVDARLLW